MFCLSLHSCDSTSEPQLPERPFEDVRLLTIGDSLTACCEWQPYLCSWLGFNWSSEETVSGIGGYAPMAVGGTWVKPNAWNSIFLRAFDAVHYSPDVIFLYVASNDPLSHWVSSANPGSSPDEIVACEPVCRIREVNPQVSSLSAYKGIIELLQHDCPDARIYLIGIMPIYMVPGMNPTEEFAHMYPSPRFETMEDVIEYERTERYPKLELVRACGRYYNLPVIDLWTLSGIDNWNAHLYYGEVAGDCTQVHPNELGNRRVAECIRDFLLSEMQDKVKKQ